MVGDPSKPPIADLFSRLRNQLEEEYGGSVPTDMIDRVGFSSAEDRGGCGSGVAVATGGGVVPVAGGVWLGVGDGRSVGGAMSGGVCAMARR